MRKLLIFIALIAVVIVVVLKFTSTSSRELEQGELPSARVDGVGYKEFDRRRAINNDFFSEINNRYQAIILGFNKVNCSTAELPNIEKMQEEFEIEYKQVLDSVFVSIETSSFYSYALNNLSEHNKSMFDIISSTFPLVFWYNTERFFIGRLASFKQEREEVIVKAQAYRVENQLDSLPEYLLDYYQKKIQK